MNEELHPAGQAEPKRFVMNVGSSGEALRLAVPMGKGGALRFQTEAREEALHRVGGLLRSASVVARWPGPEEKGSASVQGCEKGDSFIPSAALRAEEAHRSGCAVGLICGRLLIKRLGLKPKKGKRFGGGNLANKALACLRPAGAAVPAATKKPGRTPAMAKKREL